VGATPIARTQVVKIEKSTSVAPLPTINARPKRTMRVTHVSCGTHRLFHDAEQLVQLGIGNVQ
jgi:hypothetical protein